MTLPTLTVLLDDGSGNFPYDISSKVMFAGGFSYSRGRGDWQGGTTPSQLNLTLNNSDGRFTRGSTVIASPSPIRVDQRIRLKETINGTTFTRYTGYVKSWPVAWPAVVASFAVASITAVDAQARAERHEMKVGIAEEILADGPDGYWPLSDPVGSTSAVDASGNAHTMDQATIASGITFGVTTAPGSENSAAATFDSGSFLTPSDIPTYTTTPGFVFAFSTVLSNGAVVFLASGSIPPYVSLSGGSLLLGPSGIAAGVNDGAQHVVGIKYVTATTADVYFDGVLAGSGVATAGTPNIYPQVGKDAGTGSITFAHVAAWATSPSAARMVSITSAFDSELTDERVARLAYYADIPTGTLDAGLTTVPVQETLGVSVWPAIEEAVAAEVGVAYVDENGAVEFHNRNRGPAKTSPDLTLVASQYLSPDVQPVDDDQQILNYLETTSTVTGVTQVVRDTLSELGDGTATNPGHGRYSDSKSYLVSTDAEALDRANWIVANFAEPTTRYGTLTINLFAAPPAVAAQVLTALDIDMWLRVTSMASQNPGGSTVDVVVQGFTEQADESSWTVTCNVVQHSLYQAWILGNATLGVLDTTTRLYV